MFAKTVALKEVLKQKNQALALKQTNLAKIIHVKKLIQTVHDFESGITL